ncbi:MAG: glycosyltransferase family 9 protein [Saprospiraceae bacterium]|nr:glycosyltransferase family 9 protein [Saprospiraceae bacterium]
MVLTTSVVRCIKKQLNAEVHFLIKPDFAHVIHENPYIDFIHHLKKDTNETIESLKNIGFDLVINLQKNIRSVRICNALGVKTITYSKLNVQKWMAVNLKINKLPKSKHLVDRYFDALSEVSIKDDGEGLDYFIMPEDEYDAQELIKGFSGFQVLVLGATYFTKRIPKRKCIEIIAQYNHHTILLGGTDVHDLAMEIAILFPEKSSQFLRKGRIGCQCRHCKACPESRDWRYRHDAYCSCLTKDISVLWGNTIPEFGMYPYYGSKNPSRHKNLQVDGLSCRPCSKLGFDHCPKGHFRCMMDIAIE